MNCSKDKNHPEEDDKKERKQYHTVRIGNLRHKLYAFDSEAVVAEALSAHHLVALISNSNYGCYHMVENSDSLILHTCFHGQGVS